MRLKLIQTYLLVLFVLLGLGCSKPTQPELIRVKNLEVHEFTEDEVTLTGSAILFNPNKYSITVNEIDISVKVNDQAVGKVKQMGEVNVPANAEFEVPLNVTFNPEDVYDNLLSGIISYLMKGEFDVHYQGVIKIKVGGLVFKVPVDHMATVKI